ncbi:type II toxin-antitoxin system Phd/YefM family antitoxin [Oerskovia flava]|uniref:type II toxin-antitoxin system Phd/YefM family antitoxin n=1 Tax=Oerskovia flava TaxID=2986422 RepID=UPI00223FFF40|nr:type II toxin-antitoxin system prevent-host-death family antitoxin [Oerskovia sp. JB1-3-2]
MEVSVSALRAELKSWIERARAGEDVIITERGVPVARLTGVATADLVTELTRDGLLTPAGAERPLAAPTERDERAAGRPARGSGVSGLVRRIRR